MNPLERDRETTLESQESVDPRKNNMQQTDAV
jgi:hypothetical protein